MKLRKRKSGSKKEIESQKKCDRIRRFRNVEANINKICQKEGLKLKCLNRKPVVKLKKVNLPSKLLSELKRRCSPRAVVVAVRWFGDDDTELISDLKRSKGTGASARVEPKQKKRVRVAGSDNQTTATGEKRKGLPPPPPTLTLKVTSISDAQIPWIGEAKRKKLRIVRIVKTIRYLKPSKTETNYGLGGKSEMDRDDVDNPLKQIPEWAEERNYLRQMSAQAELDPEEIFAPCGPPDLQEIFSDYRRSVFDSSPVKC